MICGLPCSGKTALARRLERERDALRLTPDDLVARRARRLPRPRRRARHFLDAPRELLSARLAARNR